MRKILNLCFIVSTCMLIFSCSGDKKTDATSKRSKPVNSKKVEAPKKKEGNTKKNDTSTKDLVEEEPAEKSMSPEQIRKGEEILAAADKQLVKSADSKKLFRMHCATCHGFKGNMKVNGAKDLTKSKLPDAEVVAQMYFGKGLMTPYKNILKEHELVALTEYSKTLRK